MKPLHIHVSSLSGYALDMMMKGRFNFLTEYKCMDVGKEAGFAVDAYWSHI